MKEFKVGDLVETTPAHTRCLKEMGFCRGKITDIAEGGRVRVMSEQRGKTWINTGWLQHVAMTKPAKIMDGDYFVHCRSGEILVLRRKTLGIYFEEAK